MDLVDRFKAKPNAWGFEFALFSRLRAPAHAGGWRANSCFLMCRDGASSEEGTKKKRSTEKGVRGRRRERSNNRNHVGQRPWPARRSSQMDRRRRRCCCFNVVVLHRGCPPLRSVGCLLFLYAPVWNPRRGRKWSRIDAKVSINSRNRPANRRNGRHGYRWRKSPSGREKKRGFLYRSN